MTEADWLADNDPRPMLEFLSGKASERKLRLFACACARRVWRLLDDERSRQAITVAERYADGLAADAERAGAEGNAFWFREYDLALRLGDNLDADPDDYTGAGSFDPVAFAAAEAAVSTLCGDAENAALFTARCAVEAIRDEQGRGAERVGQCDLLRDLFGNPFGPVDLVPGWVTRDGRARARSAYEGRALPEGTLDPARMAVLADALEDAGCDHADLLGHLRGPGPHVRGCWALDLVLGKE